MSGNPPPGSFPPIASPASARPGGLIAMISSTALDLPKHRAAVKQACLVAGIFPVAMEELPARDATGVKLSLEMVDQAHIYIGIYALRYGWVPEGAKVSITEMEFDRAVERKVGGKLEEILIFIAHEEHDFKARDIEADKAAQRRLDAFKKRAAKGRLRKDFLSPADLALLVSEALNDFKTRRAEAEAAAAAAAEAITAAAGKNGKKTTAKKKPTPARKAARPNGNVAATASASPPAPVLTSVTHNNLPSLQPFFGREEELETIRVALKPESRIWGALIDGPGGMGKTSLAVRAAYAAPPEDFDRIIFISLKTRELDDDGVRDRSGFILTGLQELYNELARELGHADIAKAPGELRPRLLLDALRGSKILLLFDNLESLTVKERSAVLTFVKLLPQGCKAILTCRGRIGSGAEELILGQLSPEAALETLAELAKHNPVLARTSEAQRLALYEQTGGKPLLLRWTAGQLGRGHCLTIADAIAHLLSCPEVNPLEFIFGDLVDDFSPAELKSIAALTYFTQAAGVEHIAPLAEIGEHACRLALQSLVNRSLAVASEESHAFAIVPMVADFLRHRRPAIVQDTGKRLEKRAYAMIVENGNRKYDRFPVLDAVWDSIAPALPLFLEGPNDRLQVVCTALDRFLSHTGRGDEWLTLSQKAEAKALAAGDVDNAGWRAYQAGWIHYLRGQTAEVLACGERAAEHWRKAGAGVRERGWALQLRSVGHQMTKNYPAAIDAHLEVLDLWRGISEESQEVSIVLNDLAVAELRAGDLEAAETHLREALQMYRDVQDAEGVASVTGWQAELELAREDWAAAETLARRAMAMEEDLGRQAGIAWNSRILVRSLIRQGKAADGLPHARRAVEIYTRLAPSAQEAIHAILHECEQALAPRAPGPGASPASATATPESPKAREGS